uniref:Uncharacterized protein n=1 Tax=Panagrolaimus sp. PS1159 TaxID=55785 RepID=A0AC35GSB5_9BILA
MDNLDNLAFDGQNYEQHDADVKFVRDGGEVELESEHKELKFRFCSDGCMGETVTVCYHAKNPDGSLKGSCASNQCEFKAGVSSGYGTPFLWFVTTGFRSTFTGTQHICEDATLKSPKAIVTFLTPEQVFTSCEPLFNDEKVIKLTVTGAKHNCPVFVTNAKKWIPPPTTTAQNSSDLSETNQT